MEQRLTLANSCVPYYYKNELDLQIRNEQKNTLINENLIPDNDTLLSYKITKEEFSSILDYVETKLPPITCPTIIKRNKSRLSFSLACISNKEKVLTYILFKSHRIEKLATGGFCSVTLAWDITNKVEKAFRSTAFCHLDVNEPEINKVLSNRQDLFVTSKHHFLYTGSFTKRDYWERNLPPLTKTYNKMPGVFKSGFILERLDYSLSQLLKNNSLDFKTKVFITYRILVALDVLQNEFGIIHLDLKAENILVTKDNIPKIADFGHCANKDHVFEVTDRAYLRYYMEPKIFEAVKRISKNRYVVDFSAHIWSYGVLLLKTFCAPDVFQNWLDLTDKIQEGSVSINEFEGRIEKFLSSCFSENAKDPNFSNLSDLINKCLNYNANARITSRDALNHKLFKDHDNADEDLIPENETLERLKISKKEFESITKFVKEIPRPLSSHVIIKKNESNLPFSIACVPENNKIITYILFKERRIRRIGAGGSAIVTLGWDIENKSEVAFRNAYSKNIGFEKDINKILSCRQDLFVVSEICFDISKNEKAGFILERLECSLKDFLRNNKPDFKTKLFIAYRILVALNVLHKAYRIVHFDLKMENILMTKNGLPKIADFGSFGFKDELFEPIRETKDLRDYMAYEIFSSYRSCTDLVTDFPIDIWSYGVLLINLFCCDYLSSKWLKMKNELAQKNMTDDRAKNLLVGFVTNCIANHQLTDGFMGIWQLLSRCLEIDPSKRITAEEALKDPLFKDFIK